MRTPLDYALLPKNSLGQSVKEYLSEIQSALKLSIEVAHENTTKAKEKQKQYYDKSTEEPQFTVGQKGFAGGL